MIEIEIAEVSVEVLLDDVPEVIVDVQSELEVIIELDGVPGPRGEQGPAGPPGTTNLPDTFDGGFF